MIDLGYKEKDLDFDPDNIIEYDQEETALSDELCHQNEQKLGSDSPPPAISDEFHYNYNDWDKYAITYPPLYEYGNSFDTNLSQLV